jgi:hypothetical protein
MNNKAMVGFLRMTRTGAIHAMRLKKAEVV